MKLNINNFFEDILPRVDYFGRYALAIQKYVYSTEKGNSNDSKTKRALTDADFIVQEGLLRTFLEKNYCFKIFAEENSPYNDKFPSKEDTLITLDPIDETLAYMNNLPNFCIILGVFNKGTLEGALVHTPFDRKFYYATQEKEKSWVWEADDEQNYAKRPLYYNQNSNNIVVTYKSEPKVVSSLENTGIKVYQSDKNTSLQGIATHSILRREISAFFRQNVPAIDWAPLSLLIEKAGGFVTDYNGKRDNIYQYWERKDGWQESRIPSLVVSWDRELHDKILEVLKNER